MSCPSSWARVRRIRFELLDSTGDNLRRSISRVASGRLAAYRINGETGVLTPLATYNSVGQRPAAVLATRLGS
jgi:hypothetical protein